MEKDSITFDEIIWKTRGIAKENRNFINAII